MTKCVQCVYDVQDHNVCERCGTPRPPTKEQETAMSEYEQALAAFRAKNMPRIETSQLVETLRRVAREQPGYRGQTILHLNLAAAELERLAYPTKEPI